MAYTFNPKRMKAEAGQSQSAKFPACERKLKKSLEAALAEHNINSSIGKAGAGRSLSLSLDSSTQQVPEHPSLSSEGQHQNPH